MSVRLPLRLFSFEEEEEEEEEKEEEEEENGIVPRCADVDVDRLDDKGRGGFVSRRTIREREKDTRVERSRGRGGRRGRPSFSVI